jgi:hypothetical protein
VIKPSQQEFERPAQQLSSGLILGLIQVIFAVSYAALMFSGRLSSYMAYAMTATLITAAAGGLYGLFSQEPTFVSGPESGTTSVLAGVMIGLAAVPASTTPPLHGIASLLEQPWRAELAVGVLLVIVLRWMNKRLGPAPGIPLFVLLTTVLVNLAVRQLCPDAPACSLDRWFFPPFGRFEWLPPWKIDGAAVPEQPGADLPQRLPARARAAPARTDDALHRRPGRLSLRDLDRPQHHVPPDPRRPLELPGDRRRVRRRAVREIALYSGRPRGASVIAAEPVLLRVLSHQDWNRMKQERPDLASRFDHHVVLNLANTVGRANAALSLQED